MTTKTAQERPGQIIFGWWREYLRPDDDSGAVRGFRARLRRADRALDILSEGWTVKLHHALGAASPRNPSDLAALAQLLAAVKANKDRRIARALGTGDPPVLSDLRFQRLIRIDTRPELAVALRRALPQIDHACDVAALGEDFLRWSEPVRIRWCFDYFGKPAPDAKGEDATTQLEETE